MSGFLITSLINLAAASSDLCGSFLSFTPPSIHIPPELIGPCLDQCAEDDTCQSYEYDILTQKCQLKPDNPQTSPREGKIIGIPHPIPVCEYGIYRNALPWLPLTQPHKVLTALTLRRCQALCRNRACDGWSFDHESASCYLFEKLTISKGISTEPSDLRVSNKDRFISGPPLPDNLKADACYICPLGLKLSALNHPIEFQTTTYNADSSSAPSPTSSPILTRPSVDPGPRLEDIDLPFDYAPTVPIRQPKYKNLPLRGHAVRVMPDQRTDEISFESANDQTTLPFDSAPPPPAPRDPLIQLPQEDDVSVGLAPSNEELYTRPLDSTFTGEIQITRLPIVSGTAPHEEILDQDLTPVALGSICCGVAAGVGAVAWGGTKWYRRKREGDEIEFSDFDSSSRSSYWLSRFLSRKTLDDEGGNELERSYYGSVEVFNDRMDQHIHDPYRSHGQGNAYNPSWDL